MATDLSKLLKQGIRKYGVPGASLAVYRNGRTQIASAGVINTSTGVDTTDDTVFQIGSITKIFTATLIMQLAESGQVDLDAPVKTYLPDFAVLDGNASNKTTVRHFLYHGSGIEGDYFVDSGRGDECVEELQRMGRLLPQVFPPGERMSYCNFGFAMLGRIIEVVTGQTYDDALRQEIFKPLDMKHALSLPEYSLKYRCAIGHLPNAKKPGQVILSPTPWLAHGQKAAGSTPSMSVGDLMKFTHAHLNGGVGKNGTRILKSSSVRAMQQRQVKLPRHSVRGADGWGLGWMLMGYQSKQGKARVIGHDGGTVGQYSFLRLLPKQKLAVALLANGGLDATGLYDHVFAETFARMGRIRPPVVPIADPNFKLDPDRYVGTYARLVGSLVISEEKGHLYIEGNSDSSLAAAMLLPRTRLAFADKNTAWLDSEDPLMARAHIVFEGDDKSRPAFVSFGLRLFPRA